MNEDVEFLVRACLWCTPRTGPEQIAWANFKTAWQLSLDLNQPPAIREEYRKEARGHGAYFAWLFSKPPVK